MADNNSYAGPTGKSTSKVVSEWAAPRVAETHTTLAKEVKDLGRSIHLGQSALSNLQELKAAGKVPCSVRLIIPPAAQAAAAGDAEAKELQQALQKRIFELAVQTRQREVAEATARLDTLLTGDTFIHALKVATRF